MKNLYQRCIAMLLCGLLLQACIQENEVQPTSGVPAQEQEKYVDIDPNVTPEVSPLTKGRVAATTTVKLNKIRAWLYRGNDATGTIVFKIKRVSDGATVSTSQSFSVSNLATVPNQLGTSTGKYIFRLSGLELDANETYRLEVISSVAIRSSDPSSRRLYWGAKTFANGQLKNMGKSFYTTSGGSTETASVYNDVSDAVFETEYLDADGNPYIDQSQMSIGVVKSINDLSTIPADLTRLAAWQKFTTPSCTKITFEDAGLERAIRASLGRTDNKPITECDVEGITNLEAVDAGITSLSGIEHLTNLTTLSLRYNFISDVTPLQNLTKLTSLLLFANNITSIAPLGNLRNLEVLDLNSNTVTSIGALSGLTKLVQLGLAENNITSIVSLASLSNLEEVSLSGNEFTSLEPIRNLTKLRVLEIWDVNVTDFTPLTSRSASLKELSVNENNIATPTVIAALINLTRLSISNCNLGNVGFLQPLTKLTYLNLANNSTITNWQPLYGLDTIVELRMAGNTITTAQKTALQNNLPSTTIFY